MSSWSTSSFESAIMRSVCAKVFTVETVRVRTFLRPRISKCPAFGSYLTFDRLRSGNLRLGWRRLRMSRWTSPAFAWIFFPTETVAMRNSPGAKGARRLKRAALLQRLRQGRDDLRLLLLRQAEDLPERDADVRNVRLDVGLLLHLLGEAAAVPEPAAEAAADFHQAEA